MNQCKHISPKKKKKYYYFSIDVALITFILMCPFLCVCVRERGRERERDLNSEKWGFEQWKLGGANWATALMPLAWNLKGSF